MADSKINTTLTQEEHDMLCQMLGLATGVIARDFHRDLFPICLRVTNKLLAASPDFIPYDETSSSIDTLRRIH